MGYLIIQCLTFPVPFPLPPLPIVSVGKVGKREHSQKVPKREKWEKRERAWLLPFAGAKHEYERHF